MLNLIKRHRLAMFAGPPGSGKGTQSHLLQDECNDHQFPCTLFDMGQALREHGRKEENSILTNYIKRITAAGKSSAAFLPIYHWTRALGNISASDPPTLIIFDGVCRKKEEVRIFVRAMSVLKLTPVPVILLEMSEERLLKRFMARNREDDQVKEVIQNRIKIFYGKTMPALEKLQGRKGFHLVKIDGDQTVEKVRSDVKKSLEEFFASHG
jgi:adenylate kinase family enzyme